MINTFEPDIITYSDYYPFGWVMPERQGLSDHYRYGFQGQERDDEVKGSGNSMDFGARIYDSRVGRWLSVDPMEAKYPMYSTYNAFNNNPIFYTDPDGEEGVAAVNHKNKTITIKAVYYTQTIPTNGVAGTAYSPDEIKSMQKETNFTLNGLNLSVSEGDYAGYNVQFDIEFREGGQSYELSGKAEKESFEGNPIGNTFQKGTDKTHPNLFTEREEGGVIKVRGGVTQDHKSILMNEKHDTERNQIHEIFHTLFFDNDDAKKGIGSYSRNDLPNQDDINKLINNESLPKVEIKDE